MTNIVENPELNKLYLVKRNKSGSAAKRAQPAWILEVKKIDGHQASYAKVQWMYDGVIEDNVLMFYGLVKDLSRNWLKLENDRLQREFDEAKTALVLVDQLRFNPEMMKLITA